MTGTSPKIANFASSGSLQGSTFEIVLVLILIGLSYYYLFLPKKQEYNDRSAQYQKLEQDNRLIENQKRTFDDLVAKMKGDTTKLDVLDEALPLDPKFSKLYILLDSMVQSSGFTTSGLSIDANAATVVAGDKGVLQDKFGNDRKLVATPMVVNASGTLTQLTNLLQQIESAARILDVSGLDISGTKTGLLLFRINLKAYSYLPDPTAKPVGGAAAMP